MSIPTILLSPLDPNLFTGPGRLLAGVAKTMTPILDQSYGENGAAEYMRWLYVGTTGNVSYLKWDGTTQLITNLLAGMWHPIFTMQINSSGTTAGNIVVGS